MRCFDDGNVVHVDGHVDPLSDIETINIELMLADLEQAERAVQRLSKRAKAREADAMVLHEVMLRVAAHLESEHPLRTLELSDEEKKSIKSYRFLTFKPIIYAANVGEDDLPEMENEYVAKVREHAATEGTSVVSICAKIEEEIAQLDAEEAVEFLQDLGLTESGLDRLIKHSYSTLGLITFLTVGELEARAWTIRRGLLGPQAAAVIHTDFEKGYIRAEVTNFDDVVAHGGRNGAKEAGLMRVEGKDYEVKDGDVVLFRIST